MISVLKLKDIEKETFNRTTLIAIPDLYEFFDISDRYTPQETLFNIVKLALRDWETYNPLFLTLKIYLRPDINRTFKFEDNFKEYIKGTITEDQITLVPSTLLGLSFSNTYVLSPMVRSIKYVPPYIYGLYYSPGRYWVNGLYKYPIYEEYDKVSKDFTDKCGIYYLGNYSESDSTYQKLMDQIYVGVGNYLLGLKKNLSLPDFPIELFQALEEDVQKVQSELENWYSNSLPSGQYLM